MTADEQILVIPEAHFRAAGYFEGFRTADDDCLKAVLDPSQFSFRPRSIMESDPSFKQLIPYAVLRCGDDLFHYRRGAKGGEKRLASLRSIGIGGHINDGDATGDPYWNGLHRELAEEISGAAIRSIRTLGLIYDPRTAVGAVHLGIVHVVDLDNADARANDEAIAESGFAAIGSLIAAKAEFESWSQFALEALTRSL